MGKGKIESVMGNMGLKFRFMGGSYNSLFVRTHREVILTPQGFDWIQRREASFSMVAANCFCNSLASAFAFANCFALARAVAPVASLT